MVNGPSGALRPAKIYETSRHLRPGTGEYGVDSQQCGIGSRNSTSATLAHDTVIQCAGVCRDFVHLGIAICRALTIPARYFTGCAYRLDPPDFRACVEAFIGGHWILFDATRSTLLNGLVRIGLGRDAADVSVCTAFGAVTTARQNVRCELVQRGSFRPLTPHDLNETAISLDAGRE